MAPVSSRPPGGPEPNALSSIWDVALERPSEPSGQNDGRPTPEPERAEPVEAGGAPEEVVSVGAGARLIPDTPEVPAPLVTLAEPLALAEGSAEAPAPRLVAEPQAKTCLAEPARPGVQVAADALAAGDRVGDDAAPLLSIQGPPADGAQSLTLEVPSDERAPSRTDGVPPTDEVSPALPVGVPAESGTEAGATAAAGPGGEPTASDTSKLVLERLIELAGAAEPVAPVRPRPDAEAPSDSRALVVETRGDRGPPEAPRRRFGAGLWLTLLLAGLAIATVVGLRLTSPARSGPPLGQRHDPPAPIAVELASRPASPQATQPAAPPGTIAATPPGAAQGADFAAAFGAAMDATATSIPVTVRVSPKGAVILDHGKRLGTDVVVVNVERNTPRHLVAIQEGYAPERFTLDGTAKSLDIELKKNMPGGEPKPAPKPETFDPASDVADL